MRRSILVDDLVDTAGTLCAAAGALKAEGATNVVAYCTHPVLSGKAVLNVESSELNELVVTDTIPLSPEAESCNKIRQLSVSEELAESIKVNGILQPTEIAEAYWSVHVQHPSAWTQEMDLRPYMEKF